MTHFLKNKIESYTLKKEYRKTPKGDTKKMILRQILLFILFQGIFFPALAIEQETILYEMLNQQNPRTYSKLIHLQKIPVLDVEAENLDAFETPIQGTLTYDIDGILVNGEPLQKVEPESSETDWFYPKVGLRLDRASILKNFTGPLLDPRMIPISPKDAALLQKNKDAYVTHSESSQSEEQYFYHHPLQFSLHSTGEGGYDLTLSMHQLRCFLTDQAFSLPDYIQRQSPSSLAFRVEMQSPQYGFMTLNMRVSFKHPIPIKTHAFLYALNLKTQTLDLFAQTCFPPPLKKQWVKIDMLKEQEGASRETPRVRIFEYTQTPKVPRPSLIYFSRSPSSQEEQTTKEKKAYYRRLSHLHHTHGTKDDSAAPGRVDRSTLMSEITKSITHRATEESGFFSCILQKTSQYRSHEAVKMPKIRGKISRFSTFSTTASTHLTSQEKWTYPENRQAFTLFLENCCRALSKTSFCQEFVDVDKVSITFHEDIPPSGYYWEEGQGEALSWRLCASLELPGASVSRSEEIQQQTSASAPSASGSSSFSMTCAPLLFLDSDLKLDDFFRLTSPHPQNLSALTIIHVNFTLERFHFLLTLLQNNPFLSRVQLNGCSFESGMLPDLIGALQKIHTLENVDLSSRMFLEGQYPLSKMSEAAEIEGIKTLLRSLPHLKELTFSNAQNIPIRYTRNQAGEAFSRQFFCENVVVTPCNASLLDDLPRDNLHTQTDTLTLKSLFFSDESSSDPKRHSAQLISALSQWTHVTSLSIISPTPALPPHIFDRGLVGYRALSSLVLHTVPLTNLDSLASLATECPNLHALTITNCFTKREVYLQNLFKALKEFSQLAYLDISSNRVAEGGEEEACALLPKTLLHLKMRRCFPEETKFPLHLLSSIVKKCSRLKTFDLTHNTFWDLSHPEDLAAYQSFIDGIIDLSLRVTLFIGNNNKNAALPFQRLSFNMTFEDEGNPDTCEVSFTPYNQRFLKRFILQILASLHTGPNPSPNPQHIECTHLLLDRDTLQSISSLFPRCPSLRKLSFRGCFQSKADFLTLYPSIQVSRTLRVLDLSRTPFEKLYESYGAFRHDVSTLFRSLETIFFTSPEGEFVEWSGILDVLTSHTKSQLTYDTPQTPSTHTPAKKEPWKVWEEHDHVYSRTLTFGVFVHPFLTQIKEVRHYPLHFFPFLADHFPFLMRLSLYDSPFTPETAPLVSQTLKSLHCLRDLTIKRCQLTSLPLPSLLAFINSLREVPLITLDISGEVFSHATYEALVEPLKGIDTLRTLHLCIPKRDNHVKKRATIGSVLGGVGGGIGGFFLGGPLGAAAGAAAGASVFGGGGAASGPAANAYKKWRNKTSEQCLNAVNFFANSSLDIFYAYNIHRGDDALIAMETELNEGSQIQFVLSHDLESATFP